MLATASIDISPIRRALLSVSDKQGLTGFAHALVSLGVELISSGGTRRHLQSAGIPAREVADYTGFPEMLDGRVKTLHPKIHGGILLRRDLEDQCRAAEQAGIGPIDLVVVNLYPFEETIARPGTSLEEAIEHIDIGGPSLIRGAAKNYRFVTVVTAPEQYACVLAELGNLGGTRLATRRALAMAAFDRTARYDAAITLYLRQCFGAQAGTDDTHASPPDLLRDADAASSQEGTGSANPSRGYAGSGEGAPSSERFPERLHVVGRRLAPLRYGENPHQAACLYDTSGPGEVCLTRARQIHGKDLSYNNYLDLDSALAIVRFLDTPAVAVVKHNNPCGAATSSSLALATRLALEGDPVSAFGSVIALNRGVDAASAEVLSEPGRFVEAIVAPAFETDALQILTTRPKWRHNVRLLELGAMPAIPLPSPIQIRSILGGLLAQDADDQPDPPSAWTVVTHRGAGKSVHGDVSLAWNVVRQVKSNAIVVCAGGAVRGVGAGQMSRVDAVRIALDKAGEHSRGAVLASDAFFPFPDSIELAAGAGVAVIIQPGGSKKDAEVVEACNRHKLAMIFTGKRHFRH